MPKGEIKPFVQVVIGFFILTMVINPIVQLIRGDYAMEFFIPATAADTEAIIEDGNAISSGMESAAFASYKNELARQMESLVS